jgi:DNA-binding transcriptional ArsR family regulator
MSELSQDVMEVTDVEVFEVLNNPLRFRILRRLSEPTSIRAVAEELGMPPTRLYYHFNLLEEAGVIEVAETRKVGAMLQKLYRSKAKTFRPAAEMARGDMEPEELARVTVGVVLDGARADAEEAVAGHFQRLRSGEDIDLPGALGRSVAFFSEERAAALEARLDEIIKEFFLDNDEDGAEYGLSFAFFPLAGSSDTV